jgi:hypothetical protein
MATSVDAPPSLGIAKMSSDLSSMEDRRRKGIKINCAWLLSLIDVIINLLWIKGCS